MKFRYSRRMHWLTRRWRQVRPVWLGMVFFAILAIALYVGTKQSTDLAGTSSPTLPRTEEGRDERHVASSDIEQYNVPADAPRLLTIPVIGVKARILPMGLDTQGVLQSPNNISDVGWYTGSAKPGTNGAMLVDGHVSGPTKPGVFKQLASLKRGDVIYVERGDGKKSTYSVKMTENTPVGSIDMRKAMQPIIANQEGLNLITCSGRFDAKTQTYDHRTIVYAVRDQL